MSMKTVYQFTSSEEDWTKLFALSASIEASLVAKSDIFCQRYTTAQCCQH